MTTDVQNVRIENTNNLLIQCSYVPISADGAESVTGTIPRNNTKGAIVELGASCYNQVLVYDWESDGTIGTIPILVNGLSALPICPTTALATTTATTTTTAASGNS